MKKTRLVVVCLVLCLFVSGLSICCSASDSRTSQQQQPYSYYRGRPMLSVAISSMFGNRISASSVALPIIGNVYPKGYYYAHLNIGQPPKPYFLDPDTGSDLTWLQCDAPCVSCTPAIHPLYKPSNDLVHCTDPLCAALQHSDCGCENLDQCDYNVMYADGSSSYGVLLRDIVSVNFTSGVPHTPRLAIGCGYEQNPSPCSPHHYLDGVLGLGKGKASIVSQLHEQGFIKNVVGHCLSGRGDGYIFFGDGVYDSSRVMWTPMSHDQSKHYSAGPAELMFGGKPTGIRNFFATFDSGSSYTYFATQPYNEILSLLTRDIGKSLERATDDNTLEFCWKAKKPFKSLRDVKKYFKPIALGFGNGKKVASYFDIPPENYLIVSEKGNACLGILDGTGIGAPNFNIIGDISMQDKMVIYDNGKKMIGWRTANCDRIPKGKESASSFFW